MQLRCGLFQSTDNYKIIIVAVLHVSDIFDCLERKEVFLGNGPNQI